MNATEWRILCAGMFLIAGGIACTSNKEIPHVETEKTIFQTAAPWKAVMDIRADVAVIYGTHDHPEMSFEERLRSWQQRGYYTHFITGVAWGEYQDYFMGKWDGKEHFMEGQMSVDGDTIWHGATVPYLVPTSSFISYMKEKHIKRVIDAGIDVIYLEEPGFWTHAGYSEAFKEEWKKYYGFDWRPQHESPENTYLSNKLKYHLYYHALDELFSYAKAYGKQLGRDIRCFVPTHSLINYSQWQIVSPEASLASLDCVDGYIAQVWTGTSRVPNYYQGVMKERVFETAFLEYGSMESMTAPTGRKMYFLTDPIEDRPRDWDDFKKNYEATFTAQLLYPQIADYEVMPWPERIYEGLYEMPETREKETIPHSYSTQIQVMINALNQMPLSDNKISGSAGISVMVANSMMFQGYPEHRGYTDPQLSNFFGQTLPFLKRGIPVKVIHMENISYPEAWKDTKVLILSYANMRPMSAEVHAGIAAWVKNGGILVYCGRDSDPFQTVTEWWNQDGLSYRTPSGHLFRQLGLNAYPKDGSYSSGKGMVCIIRKDPKEFMLEQGNDKIYVAQVRKLYEEYAGNGQLEFKNNFRLERGPFDIVAVMDESVSLESNKIKGLYIDLFDPELPVITEKEITPGNQAFLYNLERITEPDIPQVLATAARVYQEKVGKNSYSFIVKSPAGTTNVMRVLLPALPKKIKVKETAGRKVERVATEWDPVSKTYRLQFDNHPDGIRVQLKW
ncbi:MAG: hypothetical protein LUD02_04900 [Tannerellaceae bacterium]|nr:hypothetical protein [Tannerellaceae bacterium]